MFFSVFNFLSSYLNNVLRQKYCFIVSFDGTFFFSLLGEFGVLYSQSTTMTSTFIYQFELNLYVDSVLRQQYFVFVFLGYCDFQSYPCILITIVQKKYFWLILLKILQHFRVFLLIFISSYFILVVQTFGTIASFL